MPTSNNPMAGISIPSLAELASRVVQHMGSGQFDMSKPIHRQRVKDIIERELDTLFTYELESALQRATERALTHVFKTMRDADYQAKRKARSMKRAAELKVSREEKAAKLEEERKRLRMDKSKSLIKQVEGVKTVIQ